MLHFYIFAIQKVPINGGCRFYRDFVIIVFFVLWKRFF